MQRVCVVRAYSRHAKLICRDAGQYLNGSDAYAPHKLQSLAQGNQIKRLCDSVFLHYPDRSIVSRTLPSRDLLAERKVLLVAVTSTPRAKLWLFG